MHIDRKSSVLPEEFIPELQYAACRIIDRTIVNWGGYSQINVTIRLLEAAVKAHVDVIHYLQGADLPLKTADQIDSFMEKNRGKNFLNFQPAAYEFAKYKVLCKHFFVEFPRYRKCKWLHWINHGVAHLQKPFMDRSKMYYHGSALFSITREFAEYVLDWEKEIQREYRFSISGDEVFLHTIFMNSTYATTLSESGNARLIDWNRREGSSPHTFTIEDLDLIKANIEKEDCLFVRKISVYRDVKIAKEIERLVGSFDDSV